MHHRYEGCRIQPSIQLVSLVASIYFQGGILEQLADLSDVRDAKPSESISSGLLRWRDPRGGNRAAREGGPVGGDGISSLSA